MSELSKFLTEYCKLWKFIGYKLGLKDTVIDMIKGDYSTQRECFMATLQIWLEQDVGPTWNALELAITNARREEQNLEPLNESKRILNCTASVILIATYCSASPESRN